MRKAQKERILEILRTFREAHKTIKNYVGGSELEKARVLLGECQENAVQLGGIIEESEGGDCLVVRALEAYCEELYQVSAGVPDNIPAHKVRKLLNRALLRVEDSVKTDIPVRLEIVFLPYKASMWDSMESVWRAADNDPDCDAYVIPIPYYDREPDGSFGKRHYEGGIYPNYVPITRYDCYDFEKRRPDAVFIHNGYDDCNFVTSVHPDFYSRCIKKFTDLLLYIPYFISVNSVSEGMCIVPGCLNADRIFVQSEKIRQEYIHALQKTELPGGGRINLEQLEKKVVALGSPKFDKAVSDRPENYALPEQWRKLIEKPDGSAKKIVLYNTSISAILQENERCLEKIRSVLDAFRRLDDVVLWWRPHPLSESSFRSMRPHLLPEYLQIVHAYQLGGWGIYDDTADVNRAVAYADCYYGDVGSALQASFQVTGKPVMQPRLEPIDGSAIIPRILGADDTKLYFCPRNSTSILSIHLGTNEVGVVKSGHSSAKWFPYASGVKLEDTVYFSPCGAEAVLALDTKNGQYRTVPYKIETERLLKLNPSYVCDWNFAAAYTWNGSVFFAGNTYPAIMCLDHRSGSLAYYTDWPSAFHNGDSSSMMNRSCQMESKIVLVGAAPVILYFDMETRSFSTEEIPHKSAESGFCGAVSGGGFLWLTSAAAFSVLKFDPCTKNVTEYNRLPAGVLRSDMMYSILCFARGYLWLFPGNTNAVLRLCAESGEISVIRMFPSQHDALYGSACLIGTAIYAARSYFPGISVYDAETGAWYDLSLSAKAIRAAGVLDYAPKDMQEAVICENGIDTVETLPYTTIRDSEKLTADWIASPDGRAGERIYDYVKSTVFSNQV